MKSTWALSQEAFDRLLAWLDPDRDRAGERYEEIRRKLIGIFLRRGCSTAEDLTDEAINRVKSQGRDRRPNLRRRSRALLLRRGAEGPSRIRKDQAGPEARPATRAAR